MKPLSALTLSVGLGWHQPVQTALSSQWMLPGVCTGMTHDGSLPATTSSQKHPLHKEGSFVHIREPMAVRQHVSTPIHDGHQIDNN